MNCPNCKELTETGAAFCGNCGQALTTATPVASPVANVPAYAVPVAGQQSGQIKAAMSLVLGTLGIVAALFIPIAGLLLGVGGVVLATLSRRSVKHVVGIIGLIVSCLAVIVGLAIWAYAISQDSRHNHQNTGSGNVNVQKAFSLSTPCYSIEFLQQLTVEHAENSCDMNAYNGANLNDSTNAYKIYAINSTVSTSGFNTFAKQAIEKDIHQTLPGFTIDNEVAGEFADSPAYYVTATNGRGIRLVEAVALHKTAQGSNFFIFVHAVNEGQANLNELQSGWKWQ